MPPHAYGSAFLAGGGCGTAPGPGPGCLAVPEGWWGGQCPWCHRAVGQQEQPPGEPGLGRERREVSVQRGCRRPCHPELAGSGEAHAGKSVQLAQHPQGHGPGCHSGGVLCLRTWLCPHHQGGEQALGLPVRRGTTLGGTRAAQHGSEDGSIPSVWRHGSPAVGWGSRGWQAVGKDPRGDALCPERRVPN